MTRFDHQWQKVARRRVMKDDCHPLGAGRAQQE